MTLQPIDFTGTDNNYSFYVSRIVVSKLECLKSLVIIFLAASHGMELVVYSDFPLDLL
jgi:hypothetical protein